MPYRKYRRTDLRRYIAHARVLLGRRGAALLLLGLIWIAQGVSVLVTGPNPDYPLLVLWPLPRAAAWIITGCIALIYAWRERDACGFSALYVMAAYRLMAYALPALDWLDDAHGGAGNPRGIVGCLSWLTIVGFIILIAGWPEAEDVQSERMGVNADGLDG